MHKNFRNAIIALLSAIGMLAGGLAVATPAQAIPGDAYEYSYCQVHINFNNGTSTWVNGNTGAHHNNAGYWDSLTAQTDESSHNSYYVTTYAIKVQTHKADGTVVDEYNSPTYPYNGYFSPSISFYAPDSWNRYITIWYRWRSAANGGAMYGCVDTIT
jgi:hypothetical protein